MQVTPSSAILQSVCDTIHQAFDHRTTSAPPLTTPLQLLDPPFSTKLMVALVTPLPTHTRPNYQPSQKHRASPAFTPSRASAFPPRDWEMPGKQQLIFYL